jgi:SOS response regulatory protein OraA/RecX
MNQRIYNYSIHLLARQDYSAFKLRQKLRSKKDNPPHEVEEIIETLKSRGLLKEENYKRLFIRKWMIKGESANKIRQRGSLEKLEFSDDDFKNAGLELGFEDQDSLKKLIDKKLRSKVIPREYEERLKLKNKMIRFLISKGHAYEECKKALQYYFV